MENLVDHNYEIFKNKKVFVTGNAGFKGTWLELWLKELGAIVKGYSLDEERNKHHKMFNDFDRQQPANVMHYSELESRITNFKPDIIYHLAAQSLVPTAYKFPFETWETNIFGTINILKISLNSNWNLKGLIIATSDKVYDEKFGDKPHKEHDAIGGTEPYSASKAACELLVNSIYNSKFNRNGLEPRVVSVRAGNVIGGGDFSENRLFPDVFRSLQNGLALDIRRPEGIRPWQHVLDCISGYLFVGAKILNDASDLQRAYNFGPLNDEDWTVKDIVLEISKTFPELKINYEKQIEKLNERNELRIDSTLAASQGWKPKLTTRESINLTIDWYRYYLSSGKTIALDQLSEYRNMKFSSNENS